MKQNISGSLQESHICNVSQETQAVTLPFIPIFVSTGEANTIVTDIRPGNIKSILYPLEVCVLGRTYQLCSWDGVLLVGFLQLLVHLFHLVVLF
jgi:hypothetical protein